MTREPHRNTLTCCESWAHANSIQFYFYGVMSDSSVYDTSKYGFLKFTEIICNLLECDYLEYVICQVLHAGR